jgi:2-dehydro-3-deoxygluconokinase
MTTIAPVLCFGEMLLRLSSPPGQMLFQSPGLQTAWGGAEVNVAVSLARLGQPAAMATVLPDNAIGAAARDALRSHGVDTTRVRFAPGRMGVYFLMPGAGLRSSEVIYDRAHSAFADADLAALDWKSLLQGVSWLHVSGVTAALGPNGAAGALAAMRAAADAGVPASFDGNFRAKLWEAWGGDAPAILRELFSHAELVFADERDMAMILGEPFDAKDLVQRRRDAARAAFSAFPRLNRIASTLRESASADHHDLGAMMVTRDGSEVISPLRRLAGVIDRVGAGDAFAAGLLSQLLKDRDDAVALEFALTAACLKHYVLGDFNLSSSEGVEHALTDAFDIRR